MSLDERLEYVIAFRKGSGSGDTGCIEVALAVVR